MEGKKRFLTLKNVQLDQAGEVSYQALNAITSAMLTVKGMCVMTVICIWNQTINILMRVKNNVILITFIHTLRN